MKRAFLGSLLSLLLSSTLWAQGSVSDSIVFKRHSFGLGIGIPTYGGFGGNIDLGVFPSINISAGLGFAPIAGIGYNLGIKYLLKPMQLRGWIFRPKISCYYGVNSRLSKVYVDKARGIEVFEVESGEGISLGIGSELMWSKTQFGRFDVELIYIATNSLSVEEFRTKYFVDGGEYELIESDRVQISLGYRIGF